jgi:hypothetical protein
MLNPIPQLARCLVVLILGGLPIMALVGAPLAAAVLLKVGVALRALWPADVELAHGMEGCCPLNPRTL